MEEPSRRVGQFFVSPRGVTGGLGSEQRPPKKMRRGETAAPKIDGSRSSNRCSRAISSLQVGAEDSELQIHFHCRRRSGRSRARPVKNDIHAPHGPG